MDIRIECGWRDHCWRRRSRESSEVVVQAQATDWLAALKTRPRCWPREIVMTASLVETSIRGTDFGTSSCCVNHPPGGE